MALTAADIAAWRDDVASKLSAMQAAVVAETARNPGGSSQEQFLRRCNLGHLRRRVIETTAHHAWLAAAYTVVQAGGSHPAQYAAGWATSNGTMSIPTRPPRSGSL